MTKRFDIAVIEKVSRGRALPEEEFETNISTRKKMLNAIPDDYFAGHQRLKNRNDTSLDFSHYIYEAIREKLKRDGAI